jgi:hypothetical protein
MSLHRASHSEGFFQRHTQEEEENQPVMVIDEGLRISSLRPFTHSGDPDEWTSTIRRVHFPMVQPDGIKICCEISQQIVLPTQCGHRECGTVLEFGLN